MTLWERAEQLCRIVAPHELTADVPCYIVPQSELPADLGGDNKAAEGFVWRGLDLALREHLGDRWRGRGPAMVINDAMIREKEPDHFEQMIFAITLHEFAHCLDRGRLVLTDPEPDPATLKESSLIIAQALRTDHGFAPGTPRDLRWQAWLREFSHHNAPRFQRICLHLRHRAEVLAGVKLSPANIDPPRWDISHPSAYQALLGDEPAEMLHEPFANIFKRPLPADYLERWYVDVRDFYQCNPTREKPCLLQAS